MAKRRVAIVGAGLGGLAAAVDLAVAGCEVTLFERAATPGGKLREAVAGGARIDAGPTVFTLRAVFEELFAAAGSTLTSHLTLQPATVLARHAWADGGRLDLFADIDASADAIAAFAGPADARGYRAFCDQAARIWRTLERSFVRAATPTPLSLAAAAGLRGLPDLLGISPFAALWDALGKHFRDARLRQLFGRYATYCGTSPYTAPATLMLVAHVEQAGVWYIEGGMHRLAVALADLAAARGAVLRYGAEVTELLVGRAGVRGVRLASGEEAMADAVVLNAESQALAAGRFGEAARAAVPPLPPARRSLSAVTWALLAEAEGFPLVRHNVFFSADYRAEFDAIARGALPGEPTVYVCAQDREDAATGAGAERLLCLVNAPPCGDTNPIAAAEIARCESRTFDLLRRCGLTLRPQATVLTTPAEWERMFPATGGALYGRALNGWQASFQRPTARSRIPGLYLAGGSVHPGPGVPMAALSGRLAAAALRRDWTSRGRSRATATSGGMSMR